MDMRYDMPIKLNKYQQFVLKMRERQLAFEITVVPEVIGVLSLVVA